MRPRSFFVLLVIAVTPLVLSSVASPFPETIRSISQETFKPLFTVSHFLMTQVSVWVEGSGRLVSVYRENSRLKEVLTRLQGEVTALKEQVKQADRLHLLSRFREGRSQELRPARVIFRSAALWNQSLVIDKGDREGIQKHAPVVSTQGLVGRVVRVSHSTAQVLLAIDAESRISVQSQESRDAGLLVGVPDSGGLRIKFLDLNAKIQVGDTVITSGLGGVYPKGIPVGRITRVDKDGDGLYLGAAIRPFVEFSKIEEVLCLAPTLKEQDFFASL